MTDLSRLDIKYLKGVGPKRAALLATELGISSYYDLLYDFPFRYIDRSQVYTISSLQGDSLPSMQFKGRFISFTTHGEGRKRRLQALFTDGTGTIEMVWFNRVKSLLETYKTGVEYIVFGQPKLFKNTYSIIHPEVDVYKPETAPRGLVGVYNLTEKLLVRTLQNKYRVGTLLNLRNLSGNLVRELEIDIVRITEAELEKLACGLNTVTYTYEFLAGLETFRNSNYHIVDESTIKPVHSSVARLVCRSFYSKHASLNGDLHVRIYLLAELSLRAFNLYHIVIYGD